MSTQIAQAQPLAAPVDAPAPVEGGVPQRHAPQVETLSADWRRFLVDLQGRLHVVGVLLQFFHDFRSDLLAFLGR